MTQPQPSIIPMPKNMERYPEGILLREQQGSRFFLFFWGLFALLWNGISWPIAISALVFGGIQNVAFPDNLKVLMLGFFCLLGLVFLGLFIRQVIIASSFGPAELFVEHLPFRLGEQAVLRFRRKTRGSFDIRAIEVKFFCQEWVQYRSGTDTKTDTQIIWSQDLPANHLSLIQNSEIDMSWTVTIPADQPPSFSSKNNAIQWRFYIKIDAAGRPNPRSEFLLAVLPEVLE